MKIGLARKIALVAGRFVGGICRRVGHSPEAIARRIDLLGIMGLERPPIQRAWGHRRGRRGLRFVGPFGRGDILRLGGAGKDPLTKERIAG